MLIRKTRLGIAGERGDRRSGLSRPPAADQRPGGRADPGSGWPFPALGAATRIPLPGCIRRTQRPLCARPADHRRERFDDLQQFLRIRLRQVDLGRAQALKLRPWTVKIDGMVEKPITIDFDDLLNGSPRRAALPSSLRRGLVDGGAVDRISDGGAGRSRSPARLRDIRADGDILGPGRPRRSRGISSIPGPMSRG